MIKANFSWRNTDPDGLWAIIVLYLCLALTFFNSPGTVDVGKWLKWLDNANSLGLIKGFAANAVDYPPGTVIILKGFYEVFAGEHFSNFHVIKLSIALFLFFSLVLAQLLTGKAVVTVLLLVSLILNSVALGYVDILFVPFLLGALWAVKQKRFVIFGFLFSLAALIKWQPIILLPYLMIYIADPNSSGSWRINLSSAAKVLLTLAGTFIAFAVIFDLSELTNAFRRALNHPYLSGNALNFNWLLTWLLKLLDPITYEPLVNGLVVYIKTSDPLVRLARLIFFGFYFYSMLLFLFQKTERTLEDLYAYSILGYLSYFMFNVGVHENHLFLAAVLFVLIYGENRKWLLPMIVVSIVQCLNLFVFYGVTGRGPGFNRVIGGVLDVSVILAFLNILIFFWIVLRLVSGRAVIPGRIPHNE